MENYKEIFKENLTKADILAYINCDHIDNEKLLAASLHTKWFGFIFKTLFTITKVN